MCVCVCVHARANIVVNGMSNVPTLTVKYDICCRSCDNRWQYMHGAVDKIWVAVDQRH